MSYYEFQTGTTLGGKYADNWTSGVNRQKRRWKRWTNSTGSKLFIPENSQPERTSVHNNLQAVSGVSRDIGFFGSPDGTQIVTSTPATNDGVCYNTVGAIAPNSISLSSVCPAGTTDRFGSLYLYHSEGSNYGPSIASNPWNFPYLAFRQPKSSGGSETTPDTSYNGCITESFPRRYVRFRQCYVTAQRGACWQNCGGGESTPTFEWLLIGGGGGGPSGEINSFGTKRYGGGSGAGGWKEESGGMYVSKGVTYTITIGAGGAGGDFFGSFGGTSDFSFPIWKTFAQGGGWGSPGYFFNGADGANGGGGGGEFDAGASTWKSSSGGAAIYDNADGVDGVSGNAGGAGSTSGNVGSGGGGGGRNQAGNTNGRARGGDGRMWSDGNYYAGGGAGAYEGNDVTWSLGGGGNSAIDSVGGNALSNSGGGGGAGNSATLDVVRNGGNGGSGICIIRYPDSYPVASATTGSPAVTSSGGYRYYTFTGSGTIRWD